VGARFARRDGEARESCDGEAWLDLRQGVFPVNPMQSRAKERAAKIRAAQDELREVREQVEVLKRRATTLSFLGMCEANDGDLRCGREASRVWQDGKGEVNATCSDCSVYEGAKVVAYV